MRHPLGMSPSHARPHCIRHSWVRLIILGGVLLGQAADLNAHPEPLHGFIDFPEYDVRTACLHDRSVLVPAMPCVNAERNKRAQLLAHWAEVARQYAPTVTACISLLQHPDAAPASYTKLLDCMTGELYASE